MSPPTVVVVGAGVAGCCCALTLARRGWAVTLVDGGGEACSPQAGGMLAPISEVDHAEPPVVRAGLDSVARWRALLGEQTEVVQARGSLLTALQPEWPLLDQLVDRVRRAGLGDRLTPLDRRGIGQAEPALAGRFARAMQTADEGAIEPVRGLETLSDALANAGVVRVAAQVDALDGSGVRSGADRWTADRIVDARGLGAREDLPLRGVRGEFALVRTPEVTLTRPVRVLHPRHPLYVVPRDDGRFYVGATELERDDLAPPTVRSLLELLSLLHVVHPAFGDAEVLQTGVGRRPSMPDHAPRVVVDGVVVRVNGLHRHGWLLSPILAETVAAVLADAAPPPETAAFVEAA